MHNGMPATCPLPAELAEFATGRVPGPAFQRLAEHIEGCNACAAVLDACDCTDPLVSQLKQAATKDLGIEPPVPEELLAAARSCYGLGGLLREGMRLGKFELLEELGVGSFGHVFRARDTELGRTVAIKIPRAGRLARREDVDRFVREAQTHAQLKHPGIVAVHETGQTEDGIFFLVEEFVQGETLAAAASGPAAFVSASRGRSSRLWPMPSTTPTATA